MRGVISGWKKVQSLETMLPAEATVWSCSKPRSHQSLSPIYSFENNSAKLKARINTRANACRLFLSHLLNETDFCPALHVFRAAVLGVVAVAVYVPQQRGQLWVSSLEDPLLWLIIEEFLSAVCPRSAAG